jgi:hypothetical protein
MLFEAMMDNATCHVIYVNRTIREDRLVRVPIEGTTEDGIGVAPDWESEDVQKEVQVLTKTFGDGKS